jgi:hypothetical protein
MSPAYLKHGLHPRLRLELHPQLRAQERKRFWMKSVWKERNKDKGAGFQAELQAGIIQHEGVNVKPQRAPRGEKFHNTAASLPC